MSNIISIVMGVILAFMLVVLAPMTISRMADDAAMKRQVLNEAEIFIDRVTDKGSVTASDMDDLLIGINAHGGAFDVTVVRYIRVVVQDYTSAGGVKNVYCATDDDMARLSPSAVVTLNPGDAVQVRVQAVTRTKGQKLIYYFLGVSEEPFTLTLAGTVR